MPEEQRSFRTKCGLALDLVQQARRQGLRYRDICVGGGFGSNPQLLQAPNDKGEAFVIGKCIATSVFIRRTLGLAAGVRRMG